MLENQSCQMQTMEVVGRLASGVAHDFNNLLTLITGHASVVFDSLPADDPNREQIGLILQASTHAATLTRQLLTVTRQQVPQPQIVDLNLLLGNLIKLLRQLLGARIVIAFVPGDDLGLTTIDPVQFEQIMMNLAVNARDAMPTGGQLTIETHNVELEVEFEESSREDQHYGRPGRYIQVIISDTGDGMDAATRARIFEPFFTTKAPGKGTGLGLAMVYSFVTQSGGYIEVRSKPGYGTTFTLLLPRTEAAAPRMA
jgi:signal transduction histidine kinase